MSQIYLTAFSMGARAAWPLLMQHPDTFAGAVLSSGVTLAPASQLEALLGISIRSYYGAHEDDNLDVAAVKTQQEYVSLALFRYMLEHCCNR